MSKLKKQDFDDYLGNENFYNEEDKERFYRNINKENRWRKHWIPQTLTVALVFSLLIVGIQLFQGDLLFTSSDNESENNGAENNTDWSNWIEAENLEVVNAFYEASIPGYKIAEELGQVIVVNQKHRLNDHVHLYIDKVWYHEDKIHLFYSIDLSDEDFVTDNWDTGIVNDFHIHGEDNTTVQLKVDSLSRWSGVVHDKLHRVATITLEDESQLSELEKLTATLSVDAHNEDVTIPEVVLPVFYGNEKITSYDIHEFHQSINSMITLRRYDVGGGKGYLFGAVESHLGQDLEILGGVMVTDREKIGILGRTDRLFNGDFVIDIPELSTKDISFEFDYLSMIENARTIDIPIDVSNYSRDNFEKPVENTMNQGIGSIHNSNFYLRSIRFDEEGVTVGISTEKVNQDNSAQIQFNSSYFSRAIEHDLPNVPTALDNNGEKALESQFLPIENEYDSDIQYYGLTKDFIVDKEEVIIKITRLSFGEEFDWKVVIPKQN